MALGEGLKLALPSLEERPLVRHHLPWGPWGALSPFPALPSSLLEGRVEGGEEAGGGLVRLQAV